MYLPSFLIVFMPIRHRRVAPLRVGMEGRYINNRNFCRMVMVMEVDECNSDIQSVVSCSSAPKRERGGEWGSMKQSSAYNR